MNWWRKIASGFRALFRKEQLDQEMDEEMRFHVEMRVRENIEAGMSPVEARYAALRRFGWALFRKERLEREITRAALSTSGRAKSDFLSVNCCAPSVNTIS